MQVGDILTRKQLDQLPLGSVAVYDQNDGRYFNTVVRTPSGFSWIDQSKDWSNHVTHALGGILVDGWKLVHLPAVPALKVGDVIETEEQAKALPIGTVVIDDDQDEDSLEGAPAIKVEDDRWMFRNTFYGQADYADNGAVTEHRVVYIPASADTGAGSTAA